ncbi:MAG TPA: hypothetical protein VGL48_13275 [Acidimicrobiales bacterium]
MVHSAGAVVRPVVGLAATTAGGLAEVATSGRVTTLPSPSGPSPTRQGPPTADSSSGSPGSADPTFPGGEFRQSVVGQAVASDSTEVVANLNRMITQYYDSVGVNEMPMFNVPADQPLVPVSVLSGCSDFRGSTGREIPIPAGAYTTDANYRHDSDLLISQPSTNSIWELWRATKSSDGSWSACWGGKLDPETSDGVFPYPYGLSASGISYAATMITENDIEGGSINHAIALQVPMCDRSTAPADRTDCASNPGYPSEGAWFRLPASVPMPSELTPFARMVFTALQHYGAVITDQAGAVMLQAETTRDWSTAGRSGIDPIQASWTGEPEYAVLTGIPWSDLQVIDPPASS